MANAVPQIVAPTREQQAELAKQERELARLDGAIAAKIAAVEGMNGNGKGGETEDVRKRVEEAAKTAPS